MRWIEASFKTKSDEIDAVALTLTEAGADGLVIEDEEDFKRFLKENKQYWDYVDEELEKSYAGVSRVKLYVADDAEGKAKLAALTEALCREPETRTVEDGDWENSWKQYYKPMEVGGKLLIIPKWEPIPQPGKRRVLRLDPGLTFGTGSHATTRMCLEQLEKYAAPQKFVLDLGCGSGILGLAALVLGCAYVAGCDVDPKSPDVARENSLLNGVNPNIYQIVAGDVIKDKRIRESLGSGYDIVLANIVSDVIIPLAPYAKSFMSPKGVFICSGIIDGREAEVRGALELQGFKIAEHTTQEGWHCFTAVL